MKTQTSKPSFDDVLASFYAQLDAGTAKADAIKALAAEHDVKPAAIRRWIKAGQALQKRAAEKGNGAMAAAQASGLIEDNRAGGGDASPGAWGDRETSPWGSPKATPEDGIDAEFDSAMDAAMAEDAAELEEQNRANGLADGLPADIAAALKARPSFGKEPTKFVGCDTRPETATAIDDLAKRAGLSRSALCELLLQGALQHSAAIIRAIHSQLPKAAAKAAKQA